MAGVEKPAGRAGIRREPAPFRQAAVREIELLTPFMARVRFFGEDLAALRFEQPASSVRLLLPFPGTDHLPQIRWTGNEFRLDDGRRPIIRTFTPLNHDPDRGLIDLDIVLHDEGAASTWIRSAHPGDPAAISGPGRGYEVDHGADVYFLLGDETALPAIGQLVAEIGGEVAVHVMVELQDPAAAIELPSHPRMDCEWAIREPGETHGEPLLRAFTRAAIDPDARLWAAGEAGAMRRLRNHLFDECGLDRTNVTVRGYWKHGR